MKQRGWDVYGLDTASAGVSVAKQLLGDRVLLMTLNRIGPSVGIGNYGRFGPRLL